MNKYRQIESLAWLRKHYRPARNEEEARRLWQFWHGYLSTPGERRGAALSCDCKRLQ